MFKLHASCHLIGAMASSGPWCTDNESRLLRGHAPDCASYNVRLTIFSSVQKVEIPRAMNICNHFKNPGKNS